LDPTDRLVLKLFANVSGTGTDVTVTLTMEGDYDSRLTINVLSSAFNLDRLSDVTITTPANDELLAYDSGSGKWINQTPGEAGVLAADGSVPLTADWDIGDARKIRADEIWARDAAGLRLTDDAGNGIFIADGGFVGLGRTPEAMLDIYGATAGGVAQKLTAVYGIGTVYPALYLQHFREGTPGTTGYGDDLGAINFAFKDSVGNEDIGVQLLASMGGSAGDNTDGQERAAFTIKTMVNGSLDSRLTIDRTGNIGIRMTPSYTLDVSGDIHCTGKLTSDGGNDPPYVLYNYETRTSIIDRVKAEVLPDKLDGAVLFFNGDRCQLELFLPSKGEFRTLDGKVLETVEPIAQTFDTEDRYYFDENAGEIKSYKVKKSRAKYRLKPDLELDPLTGKVKRKITKRKKDPETGEEIEETVGEEEVSLEEAIELVEVTKENGR